MIEIPRPLVVQSDGTLLLEAHHPASQELRVQLAAIAQLEKSPEYFHEYRITAISLWNAAQSGWSTDKVLQLLTDNARYPVPSKLSKMVEQSMASFGRLELRREGEQLILAPVSDGDDILEEVRERRTVEKFLSERRDDGCYVIDPEHRGALKMAMIRIGYPVADRAGYKQGTRLDVTLAPEEGGADGVLRPYQAASVDSFFSAEGGDGGSGVVVLPCGAGKTLVGIGILARLRTQALILTPNITALRQWKRELVRWTGIDPNQIAE